MRPTLTESEILKLAWISVLLGIAAGILFDLFRIIRIFRKRGSMGRIALAFDHILCFFEDILFFIVLTVMNVLMLSAYGGGTLRLEAPAIELTIFLIWHKTVGRFTAKFANWLKKQIIKALKIILSPVRRKIRKVYEARSKKRLGAYSKKEREKLKKRFRA